MRFSVIWTGRARRDFHGIISYLKERSPQAATRLAGAIFQRVKRLENFPESGRGVPEAPESRPALRELLIDNYRLVYVRNNQRVEILALFHARRQFAQALLH